MKKLFRWQLLLNGARVRFANQLIKFLLYNLHQNSDGPRVQSVDGRNVVEGMEEDRELRINILDFSGAVAGKVPTEEDLIPVQTILQAETKRLWETDNISNSAVSFELPTRTLNSSLRMVSVSEKSKKCTRTTFFEYKLEVLHTLGESRGAMKLFYT